MLNGLINYVPAIKYGNLVDNAELNPAISQSSTISLSAAQLISMAVTPVTLVTTTVPGTAIVADSLVFEMNPTTTTFTCPGATTLQFQYGVNTTTGNIMAGAIPQSVITSASAGYYVMGSSTTASGTVVVPNAGITLGIIGPAFATGTGTAKVILNYYIVTL